MKLIGKNSVSKYFSYFFLILFWFIAFHFIYEIIGFSVLYYKYKTGSKILSEYFLLGNDVGWAKNELILSYQVTELNFLFLSALLYIIGQVYKKALYLKSENELTI